MAPKFHKRLIALLLTLAFVAVTVVPLAAATPLSTSDSNWFGIVDWILGTLDWQREDAIHVRTSSQNTVPNMDPDGAAPAPSPAPVGGADSQSSSEGDTVPDMDPNG